MTLKQPNSNRFPQSHRYNFPGKGPAFFLSWGHSACHKGLAHLSWSVHSLLPYPHHSSSRCRIRCIDLPTSLTAAGSSEVTTDFPVTPHSTSAALPVPDSDMSTCLSSSGWLSSTDSVHSWLLLFGCRVRRDMLSAVTSLRVLCLEVPIEPPITQCPSRNQDFFEPDSRQWADGNDVHFDIATESNAPGVCISVPITWRGHIQAHSLGARG